MPKGKHEKQNKRYTSVLLVLLALLLIFTAGVGGTLSYIVTKTPAMPNVFIPATVACSINESFDGFTKSNVTVQNTGNTDAYIRAAIIVNWKNANGNVYAHQPSASGGEYTMTMGTGWFKAGDGFWYYPSSVAPHSATSVLIAECKAIDGKSPSGYDLAVEILASAIQSNPEDAVEESWGVTVDSNGIISKN